MIFKIRASAVGQIMTNGKGNITEKQLITLSDLQKKEKLTPKQSENLHSLLYKKNNPELSQTTKTYCETWLKEQYFNRRKPLDNKYLSKGIDKEADSIEFLIENGFYDFAIKNETHFENDFLTGTPDIIHPDKIDDLKNSWDIFTFPLFETKITNKLYWWQLQSYMILTGLDKARLIYILSDTPENLVEKEIFYKTNDIEYLTKDDYTEISEKIKNYHNYSDILPRLKVKIFEISKDNNAEIQIKKRVRECQNYINILIKDNKLC